MPAKKKEEEPTKDKALTWINCLGGLLVIITVLPMVPWRTAKANQLLTSRFSSARAYSLFSVGNNFGQPVSWFKMRAEVCRKSQEFSKVNPITALVGSAATSVAGTGGAVVGCANWPACKDHVVQRCNAYSTLATVGIVCMILNVVGGLAAFITPVLKSMEAQAAKKKKKMQDAAKFYTMVASIIAFACPFLSVVVWVGLSDSTFKSLQNSAFFPYPAAGPGAYVAGVGAVLLCAGMYCGVTRLYPLFPEKEVVAEEAELPEEYDAGNELPAEAAALMPGLGMGPPPPMM